MKTTIIIILYLFCSIYIVKTTCYASGLSDLKSRLIERLPEIVSLKEQGFITENENGYLDSNSKNSSVVKLVTDENNDRRATYTLIGNRKGFSSEEVGKRRAKMIRENEAITNGKPLVAVPHEISVVIKSNCTKKWPENFRMQKHCRNEEAKAWLEMN